MSVCCCVSAPGSDYSADACVSSGEGSLRRRSQRHSTTLTSRFFDVWDSLVSGKLFKSSRVKYLRTLNQRDGGNVCFPLSERSGRLLRNCKRQEPPWGRGVVLIYSEGGGGASALNQASQSKKAAVHQSEDSEEWHHTDRSSDRRGHILKARLHLRQVPSDMYMRCGRDSTPDQNLNRRTDRGRGRSEPRRKNNRFHKVLLFKV